MEVTVMALCEKCYESMRVFYQLDALEDEEARIRMCSLCGHDRTTVRYKYKSWKQIQREKQQTYRWRNPTGYRDRRARYKPKFGEDD